MGDMWQLVHRWCYYTPKVVQQHPQLFAEMYGLILAAVQLRLPFTLARSLTVSLPKSADREGWPLVDAISDKDICAVASVTSWLNRQLPVSLHYCERYMLGRYFFFKYRVRKNIMQCQHPLLVPPPVDFGRNMELRFAIEPPRDDGKLPDRVHSIDADPLPHEIVVNDTKFSNPVRIKREKFMLCYLIRGMNEALRFYKVHACGGDDFANLNEVYTVFNYPFQY
jgi:hypothetical protein